MNNVIMDEYGEAWLQAYSILANKPLNKKELYDLYITEMTNMQDKKPSIFSYLFYGYNMNLNFQSLSPIVYD
jgi:hypothetical protein